MFSGLPFYSCVEQLLAWKFSLDIKLLNYKSNCTFSVLNSLKADIFLIPYFFHVSLDPCFSGSRFFTVRIQVLEVALKVIVTLNFSLLCHDIYVYNFCSSLSKRICTANLIVMILVFRELFQMHNNMVIQEISYSKIIYESCKWCSFFYIWRRMCFNFLKYLINFF